MNKNLISIVREYSNTIKNGRTTINVFESLSDEYTELTEELYTDTPGPDGIAGESIDVILCCLDLIFLSTPGMTDEDIVNYAEKKCIKWKQKYS
jgi:hypothetical protein